MAGTPSNGVTWRAGLVWLLAIGLVCVAFPPFHVRSLSTSPEQGPVSETRLTAKDGARRLWKQMLAARNSAVDVNTVLEALERDPVAAERKYGRRIGYGGPAFYFVRGEGRVSESTRKGVVLELPQHSADLLLVTGPVFGNALRDSTPLVHMRDFDSFQFNELSAELNLLSERLVQPRLVELSQRGTMLRFVGAAYLRHAAGAAVEVVPILVESADR